MSIDVFLVPGTVASNSGHEWMAPRRPCPGRRSSLSGGLESAWVELGEHAASSLLSVSRCGISAAACTIMRDLEKILIL